MVQTIPQDIKEDLVRASSLHQRAASDYEKCQEFNKLMSVLLGRLEDAGCYKTADKVMSILIDCNPKQGAQCEKATRIGEKMKKI
ncbi:MAG: hypothetical protein OEV89_11430 [Desulfobulbaceae bacterium]|nr:hypothetical protein [Desulfobulbaceae bacterium]HIJ91272.1 hypothetical protein [Deltaproteobacteria bacterium]